MNCTKTSRLVWCSDGTNTYSSSTNDHILKVENLLPGRLYNCKGEMIYQVYENNTDIYSNASSISIRTKNANFTIVPKVFEAKITLNNKKWRDLAMIYKKNSNGNLEKINTFSSEGVMKINDLKMLTTYTLCLSVAGDGCERDEINCQACHQVWTEEDFPFEPSNLTLNEDNNQQNLIISWTAPVEPSGNLTHYILNVNETCPGITGLWCKQKFKNISLTVHGVTFFKQKSSPFCNYDVGVAAVNSKGSGNSLVVKDYLTKKKAKKPKTFSVFSDARNIFVRVIPGCPFTGNANYIMSLTEIFANGENKNEEYLYDGKNESLEIEFKQLEPATEYKLCIKLPQTSFENCSNHITIQIQPEDSPYLKDPQVSSTELVFNVKQPSKSFPMKGEKLKYNFEILSACNVIDDACDNSYCNGQERWRAIQKKSSQKMFQIKIDGLEPNRKYKIRSNVSNSVGCGPWSNWSDWFITSNANNEILKSNLIDFRPSSSGNAIYLDLQPICPFQGNVYSKILDEST